MAKSKHFGSFDNNLRRCLENKKNKKNKNKNNSTHLMICRLSPQVKLLLKNSILKVT